MDLASLISVAVSATAAGLALSLLRNLLAAMTSRKTIMVDDRTVHIDLSDPERVSALLALLDGPPRAMMIYAHEDTKFVRSLVSDLQQHDVAVWFDEDEINVGDSLTEAIRSGLASSGYAIVVLSRAALSSKWVNSELDQALHRQQNGYPPLVLPALIEDLDLPTRLAHIQYADFRGDYDHGLEQLLAAMRQT